MAESTEKYWLLVTPEMDRKPNPVEAKWAKKFAKQARQTEAI